MFSRIQAIDTYWGEEMQVRTLDSGFAYLIERADVYIKGALCPSHTLDICRPSHYIPTAEYTYSPEILYSYKPG